MERVQWLQHAFTSNVFNASRVGSAKTLVLQDYVTLESNEQTDNINET